jgi:AcrR family transcriptional regulator
LTNGKQERGRRGTDNRERERIDAAIFELVGTRGYQAVDVKMIAEQAGVTGERFERHYADKQECYFAVLEELRQDYLAMNARVFLSAVNWREGLRRTAYAVLDYFGADPVRTRFIITEALNAGDRGVAMLDSTLETLVELVHAGRHELDDPDSVPRSAAEAAVGSAWGKLLTKIRNEELDDEEGVRELMYIAVLPYLGEAAAKEELEWPRPTAGTRL